MVAGKPTLWLEGWNFQSPRPPDLRGGEKGWAVESITDNQWFNQSCLNNDASTTTHKVGVWKSFGVVSMWSGKIREWNHATQIRTWTHGHFFFFFLAVRGLGCCTWASLVVEGGSCSPIVESGSYSLVAVHGLLTAVASLIADHERTSSEVVEHELRSCDAQGYLPVAYGVFLDQGLNSSPALQGRFLTTRPPEKPKSMAFSLRTYPWS